MHGAFFNFVHVSMLQFIIMHLNQVFLLIFQSPNIFKTHIKVRRPPSRSFSVSSTELETTINQNKVRTIPTVSPSNRKFRISITCVIFFFLQTLSITDTFPESPFYFFPFTLSNPFRHDIIIIPEESKVEICLSMSNKGELCQ